MTKWTFAAIVLLACACTHGRMKPLDTIDVDVEPAGSDCLDMSRNGAIPLVVTNRSARQVAFFGAEASGPPYILHPYAFAFEFVAPKSDNNVEAILEHHLPPEHELRLGPGERAEVLAYASLWPSPGYTGMVLARVTDTNGRRYLSRELAVCAANGEVAMAVLMSAFNPKRTFAL